MCPYTKFLGEARVHLGVYKAWKSQPWDIVLILGGRRKNILLGLLSSICFTRDKCSEHTKGIIVNLRQTTESAVKDGIFIFSPWQLFCPRTLLDGVGPRVSPGGRETCGES